MVSSLPIVFISYAHEDDEAAVRLYHDLKKAGVNPWIDKENLLPGQNWRTEIKKAIRSSRYFIAVLSTNSVGRKGYVQKEVADALNILDEFPESEIFIIPIRLDDCRPSHEKMGELHWANMFPIWEDGLQKILSTLKSNPEVESLKQKQKAENLMAISRPFGSFKDIEFGKADAQTERIYHPYLLLEGFFDELEYVDKLLKGYVFLVLGPKGSGKTAIASKLKLISDSDKGLNVSLNELENFPYSLFSKSFPSDELPEVKYTVQWEFLLLISLFDNFTKDKNCRFKGKFGALKNGLQELGVFPGKTLMEIAQTMNSRDFKSKITDHVHDRNSEQEKIIHGINVILNNLQNVTYSIDSTSSYLFIIDKLDDVLTKRGKQLNMQFDLLASLILAADKINRSFKENNIKAKIIILCRDDLYSKLENPNLNKIKEDYKIQLNWYLNNEDPLSSNLIKLINLRAKNSLKRDIDIFHEFFPETVWDDPTVKTLLDNTRCRPRDIIMLLNYIKDNTKGSAPTKSEIKNSIKLYSNNYFLSEIKDEVAGFLTSDEFDKIISLLYRMNSMKFRFNELKAKKDHDENLADFDLKKAVEALYNCSAVGCARSNATGKERITFRYRNPGTKFDPDASLRIHYGLLKGIYM
ncbi:MAG: toll/interleukin-1 receptor domain-containing protein [Methanotrichaceae archaeon]|nr:toll/interleukin-1 receptor domain-containing protein [Methanotrichaceae archaeon]